MDQGSTGKGTVSRAARIALAILICSLTAVYFGCIDGDIVGFMHDDGEYAITAKALAEGRGFRLIHLPGDPAQVRYPLAYPLLLAVCWWVEPSFPDNLILMKGLTALFALASLPLLFLFLVRRRHVPPWVALVIVALVGSSYQFVLYTTSVMSEGPYLFVSMLLFMQAERTLESKRTTHIVVAALLTALLFQLRTFGLAMAVAIMTVLLLKRWFRPLLIYGAVFAATSLVPWFLWVKWQQPETLTGSQIVLLRPYISYLNMFDLVFTEGPLRILAILSGGFENLNSLFLDNLLPIIPNALKVIPQNLEEDSATVWGFVVVLYFFRYLLAAFFLAQLAFAVRRREFSVTAIYTVICLLLIMLWNVRESMPRFLLVVLPFLWYYLFKPFLPALRERGLRARPQVAFCAVVCLLAAWPIGVGIYVLDSNRSSHTVSNFPGGVHLWSEYESTFEYVRTHLPDDVPIAAREDAVFYLYTDRPTVYLHHASLAPDANDDPTAAYEELFQGLLDNGVGYIVVEPSLWTTDGVIRPNPVAMRLLEAFPSRLDCRYTSPRGLILLYEIQGRG